MDRQTHIDSIKLMRLSCYAAAHNKYRFLKSYTQLPTSIKRILLRKYDIGHTTSLSVVKTNLVIVPVSLVKLRTIFHILTEREKHGAACCHLQRLTSELDLKILFNTKRGLNVVKFLESSPQPLNWWLKVTFKRRLYGLFPVGLRRGNHPIQEAFPILFKRRIRHHRNESTISVLWPQVIIAC